MLISPKEILEEARRERHAVGHFNVYNLETAKAVTQAVRDTKTPTIIAITETTIRYAGLSCIVEIVKKCAKNEMKVAMHLDHGKNIELIKGCVKAGFTSIMFDGSALSFSENVELTTKVVKITHKHNIPVEGEVGHVGRVGEGVTLELLTNPQAAEEFIDETGVDSLAVAVGTVHGLVEELNIDFERLESIANKVKIPLVIHGGTGVSDNDLKKMIGLGASKINIDTALRIAFMRGLRQNITETDPRRPLSSAMGEVEAVANRYIRLFSGKEEK